MNATELVLVAGLAVGQVPVNILQWELIVGCVRPVMVQVPALKHRMTQEIVAEQIGTVLAVLVFLVLVHIETVMEIRQMVVKLIPLLTQIIVEVVVMFVQLVCVQMEVAPREIVMLPVGLGDIQGVIVQLEIGLENNVF